MQRLSLPVVSSRRTSDPVDSYVQRHSLLVRARDFDWSTIERGLNPRQRRHARPQSWRVYRRARIG